MATRPVAADAQKKDKKSKKPKSKSPQESAPETLLESPSQGSSKKRKLAAALPDELEIDVNAPEPPSKKALRKAKKAKFQPDSESGSAGLPTDNNETSKPKRSEHGVWIGNLPWSATKATVREFFVKHTAMEEQSITRIHLPPPTDPAVLKRPVKPHNKGFAYVDFETREQLEEAITLSEKLMDGRAVLIKDAKSFEGRPKAHTIATSALGRAPSGGAAGGATAKKPSKKVWVGNLGYDITKEDLERQFSPCGEIADVFLATFEDTGKCKGWGLVTFAELESAASAVAGFTMKPVEDDQDGSDAEMKDNVAHRDKDEDKKGKNRNKRMKKWFVNRLHGRQLRCEFGEDGTTRYKKRFGKDGPEKAHEETSPRIEDSVAADGAGKALDGPQSLGSRPRKAREARRADARTIKPGAAQASIQKASAAIVAGQGKMITFDD